MPRGRSVAAVIALAVAAACLTGCGSDYKQLRVEASGVQSSANEAATLAGQRRTGRVTPAFTNVQGPVLNEQFGKSLQSLGALEPEAGTRALIAQISQAALDGQLLAAQIAPAVDSPARLAGLEHRLAAVGRRAGELGDRAEALELTR